MAKYILSIIAAFFITLSSFAQGGLPSRFNVSYLNMAAGMPNNFADDIFQDSYGFVWISTHGGGLVRYDGFNFVNFGLGSNAISLRSNSCRNVYEDHFRRLWIAFEEGPQVLDLNTMQPIVPPCENEKVEAQLKKALKNSSSNRMYCDAKGNIWMISINLLTRFGFNEKGEVNSVLTIDYPFNAPDLGLCDVYRRGTVVLCNNGVVSEFSVKNNQLVARNITSLFAPLENRYAGDIISYHGKIWLATNRGLFNSAKLQYHCSATDHSLQHEVVTSLAISPDDKLLVGTLCGVDIFNDKTGEIEHWNSASAVNPLSSNFVNSLFAKNGQIWVATETGGVTKLAPRQLQLEFYRHDASNPGSLSPNAVNAMYAAPDGTLWVGTVEGGLNSLAPGGKNFTHYTTANSGLPHNSVSALAADNRGNLWIGTWGTGFAVMNLKQPGKITPLVVDQKYQHYLNFAGALAYDPINDGMWLGTNDGLFFYDLKHQQITEPFKGCLNVRGCIGALITKDGKLLMGCVQGMVEVNLKSRRGKDEFAVQYHPHKLDDPESGVIDKIISFCQTKDGKIWLGSNGYGLYCYYYNKVGKAEVKSFTTNQGLANNTVKGIVEDNQGMLWIATDNGLSVFNPKNETFTSFYKNDGLLSAQFYFNGAIRNAKGEIFLGTDMGMMAVKGVNHSVHQTGKLCFTELLVDNQPVFAGSDYLKEDISIARKLRIHESDKSFTLFFSALNYGCETQGVYLYRMKGYENEWVQLKAGQHSVRYSTLPAGDYKFEVKYIPSINSDKEQVISVEVQITPYFWKSWWFITILVIGIIALVQYIYIRRLNVMREREVEALYRPIEAALKDSDEPEKLQSRIQMILRNQQRYQESQKKSIEADKKQVVENTHPFMESVMEVMEKNYDNSEFGVQELSDAMGLNRSVLSKKLTAETGLPTAQFIRNYRLDIAKKMIVDNGANRNITEIAYRVGFNDPKYFTRCFTKQYGVSPTSFRDAREDEKVEKMADEKPDREQKSNQ